MPRPKKPDQDPPISIRIPPALMERIKAASKAMGLSDAEIIRLAAGVGLERLKRINYDLAKAVCDASEKKQIFPSTVVLPSPTPDRIRLNEPAAQSDSAPVIKNTRRALQKMVAKEAGGKKP